MEDTIESIRMKLSNGSEKDVGNLTCVGFLGSAQKPRSQLQNERLGDLGFHGGRSKKIFLAPQ